MDITIRYNITDSKYEVRIGGAGNPFNDLSDDTIWEILDEAPPNTDSFQPTAPTNLRCTNPTSYGNNPQFAWHLPDQPENTTFTYDMYWNAGAGYNKINARPINDTTYTHTGVELDKFGTTNYYYVKAQGSNSPDSDASNILSIKTDHAEKKQSEDKLIQNKNNIASLSMFPNPFNPSTTFYYHIPKDGYIQLDIYNISGQKIAELVNEYQYQGKYSFDFNGNSLSGGIYFIHFLYDKQRITKKMLLLK